jgi:multiple sugar transport system substrate-binding protein
MAFEADTGIKIEAIPVPEVKTAMEWSRTLALGETTYDLVDVLHGMGNPEWPRAGWIVPLDDVVPEFVHEQWFPASVESAMYEEKLYWIPHYGQMLMLGYRKDLLEEAGFAGPPQTWEELKEMAIKLTADTNGDGTIDRYGLAFPTVGDFGLWTFKSFLKGADGIMWKDDGSPGFLGAEGLAVFTLIKELADANAIPKGVVNYTAGDAGEIWAGGEVAMSFLSTGGVIDMCRNSEPHGKNLGLASPPTIKPVSEMKQKYIYNCTYNGVMVNANSKNIEAAKQLALYFGKFHSNWNEGALEGNIPIYKKVYDSPRLQQLFAFNDVIGKTFAKASTDIHKGYHPTQMTIEKAFGDVISGAKSPEEALKWIEERLKKLEVY